MDGLHRSVRLRLVSAVISTLRKASATFLVTVCLGMSSRAWPASFYPQRLDDPRAVYVEPSADGNDTAALQNALDRVQETTGQGIVFLAPGRYRLTETLFIWPGIRLIGYGGERPVLVLPAQTPGFGDATHEKVMIFFAGRRPRSEGDSVPDANPGTFYSALANVDIEVGAGNSGAVGVRARYAQHCFLAHMDFRLGPALAGIHEGGNVVEDVHFFGGTHAVWTSKPSPGWQFTLIDCSFADQREAAIFEHEAGLTLVRPRFRHVPVAVEVEAGWPDQLWMKDAWLEDVTDTGIVFGMEKNPRTEINAEDVICRNVPCFASLRESGKRFTATAAIYSVKRFSHGLTFGGTGGKPETLTQCEMMPLAAIPDLPASDIAALPSGETWVNLRTLGAKGDGHTDDTDVLQKAIADHRTIYLPSGFYLVHDTIALRPDTVLIGLHPGATQIILPDGTPGFQGVGGPKALLETPRGGSNIVTGIGLYTSGNNRRAVAALWRAGSQSMMNDVRFLGGHGTPLPDGSRENPYNSNHTADPNPNRHWDSEYPSLWVTGGGGGTFLDIWTPSTFASAGMLVSGTETEGRAYQISSEHHVRTELAVRDAAHWRFYALQTEEERGESGFALPIEVTSSHDITFANFHAYRVISSVQPFPYAIRVSGSREIRFRNVHCDSNSKASFDATVSDQASGKEVRQHDFAVLDIPGQSSTAKFTAMTNVGIKVEKLAGGFFNISGGAVGPAGDFYFVDARWQRIYRWAVASRQLSIVSDAPLEPVNLAVDSAGNLMVVSYAGQGTIYSLTPDGKLTALKSEPLATGKRFFLSASDWSLNRGSLSHPVAEFVSPDGTTAIPVGRDFLNGETSWGVKSSPPIRAFGLAPAVPGKPFYMADESASRTWKADVNPDGSLANFRLFAEQGAESVATNSRGDVYIAAGQIYVYGPGGKPVGEIDVPERPIQLVFGGKDGKTLFIAARTSLYEARTR